MGGHSGEMGPVVKVKKFRRFIQASDGQKYGEDHKGQLWRLDKLTKKGKAFSIAR
jgi:hypothetical protein